MTTPQTLVSAVLATGTLSVLSCLVGQAQNILQTPTSSYAWRNVAIVGTGFEPGIVFHPTQRDVAYVRTDIGGAYRWDATRKSWAPITDIFNADDWNMLGIESIGLDPSNPNRVYLAIGTYTNDWAGNGAIVRSNDRGKTWARTNLPFKNGGNEEGRSMGERLVVDPKQPNTVFFGTRRNGLWKSSDAGATWAKVASWPAPENKSGYGIGFLTYAPDNTLYAGVADTETSLYRSRDGGKTWQAVAEAPRGFFPHHGSFDARGTLYLTYGNGPGPNGMTDGAVWKLETQTGQWSDISPLKPNQNGEGGFGFAGLAVDAKRPGVLLVSTMDRWNPGDDIFRSTDGGKTWKGLKAGSVRDASASPFLNWGRKAVEFGHWIGDVEIDPSNPSRALYVTGATIWGTSDLQNADRNQPTHWTVAAQGIEETAVLDLVSPPVGAPLISAVADVGGFRHDDLNASPKSGMFTNPLLNTNSSLDFAQLNPALLVRVGEGGGNVHGAYSQDGGTSWSPFKSEPPGRALQGVVALSADGKATVWTPRDGAAFVSSNASASWAKVQGLSEKTDVVSDRVNPQVFYAFDASNGILLASTDGGKNFAPRATNLPKSGRLRTVAGIEGDIWLAAGGNGLHHSTDGGATFTKIEAVQNADVVGLGKAAPGANYQALYMTGRVGNVWGVFRSVDAGVTWARINDDAHQYGYIGRVITGDPRVFGRVYFATNGRGIIVGEPSARDSISD